MAYLRKEDKKICLEIYTSVDEIRQRLKVAGYVFTEESFFGGFWGTRFVIVKPIGKGAQAKINYLFDEVTR